ncbi:hypothetical protein GEMRC1_012704 [Eukaryota sp. GEM-RC1]
MPIDLDHLPLDAVKPFISSPSTISSDIINELLPGSVVQGSVCRITSYLYMIKIKSFYTTIERPGVSDSIRLVITCPAIDLFHTKADYAQCATLYNVENFSIYAYLYADELKDIVISSLETPVVAVVKSISTLNGNVSVSFRPSYLPVRALLLSGFKENLGIYSDFLLKPGTTSTPTTSPLDPWPQVCPDDPHLLDTLMIRGSVDPFSIISSQFISPHPHWTDINANKLETRRLFSLPLVRSSKEQPPERIIPTAFSHLLEAIRTSPSTPTHWFTLAQTFERVRLLVPSLACSLVSFNLDPYPRPQLTKFITTIKAKVNELMAGGSIYQGEDVWDYIHKPFDLQPSPTAQREESSGVSSEFLDIAIGVVKNDLQESKRKTRKRPSGEIKRPRV